MNLIKVYAVLFRRPISPQEYAERARLAFGYGPGATVVGIPPSDETFAKNAIREVCGDIWSMTPIPEVKTEKGDLQHFRNEPIPGGGMNEYAIKFLKRKISEREDPDYFNLAGYTVNVTTSADRITGDGALIIHIYSNSARALKPSEASAARIVPRAERAELKEAWALGRIGDARAFEPLIKALHDENEGVRWKAASALGRIGDARAVEPLIQALKDKNELVRRKAAEALVKIGEPAVKPLTRALGDKEPLVQVGAAWVLGKMGDAKAVEPLIQALKDKGLFVRALTAEALGEIGDARAVEPLIEALKDKIEVVRGKAAVALGEIKDARAVEPLIQALKDENERVREAAKEALYKIAPQQVPVAPPIVPARPTPEEVKPPEPPPKKYCIYCGSEMPVEGMYCPRCGKKQTEEVTAPAPEAPKSEWEKRYHFLTSASQSAECRFKNSSGQCVSPAADYPISLCTCSRGISLCHVYPILMQKLPLWMAEYENRMRLEAEMEGVAGECKICGNNRKLDRDRMCSVCVLGMNRANEVFEERRTESLMCDSCMEEVKKGEAFLPVYRDNLCCAQHWKTIYAKY